MNSHADYFMTALCVYREARGEGYAGMNAVACVLRNRVQKHQTSYYAEVVKPWQFSSITATGDQQLRLYPTPSETLWVSAQLIAQNTIDNATGDVTGGATIYWNPAGIESDKAITLPDGQVVKFPRSWNPDVLKFTTQIGHHIFMKEV